MSGPGLIVVIIAFLLIIGTMFLVDDETDYYQRDQLQAFRTKAPPVKGPSCVTCPLPWSNGYDSTLVTSQRQFDSVRKLVNNAPLV